MSNIFPPLEQNGSDEFFHKSVRALAIHAYKGIVQKTPRKTGRAAGNWQITINTTTDEVTGRTLPAHGAVSSQELGKLSKAKVVKFPTIYIQNALPYIIPLEMGSSSQHPQGMVRVTLAELALQSN